MWLLAPSLTQLSTEPTNNSLTLLNNPTAFYQQERYWTYHTRTALESALASTVKGTIALSVDPNSSSPPSSTAGFSDKSDYAPSKPSPFRQE